MNDGNSGGERFEVKRNDLNQTRWTNDPVPTLAPGDVLLRVDRFGLTANNITYGLYGDQFGYWRFFPASCGWGILPVWGYADVVDSLCPEIAVGERIYGYWPMAAFAALRPARISPGGFFDTMPYREALPGTYNEYRRAVADPRHARPFEDRQILLRPLLSLSWLVSEQLRAEAEPDAQIIITAASSRTAQGLARALAEYRRDLTLIGLTSDRHRGFVTDRVVFSQILSYAEIAQVARRTTIIVDISGRHATLAALHQALAGFISSSIRVGDVAQGGQAATGLPDPQPVLFFAPDRICQQRALWGAEGYRDRWHAAWDWLSEWMAGWLVVDHRYGTDAIEQSYRDVLGGLSSPDRAVTLGFTKA